jgi:hypothetical protein
MNHRPERILVIICLIGFFLFTTSVSADAGFSDNSLTRGGRFSITITGTPNTPYYFWLARTYSMSGKPGDQPPVVLANQLRVEQDPSEGPYTIGSYSYNNGNGRTILEDVAPSTPERPNTSYYGKVTTGADGRAVVTFLTSSATATRSFSVKTENPASPGNSNTLVEETVYSRTSPATPQFTPVRTTEISFPSKTQEPLPLVTLTPATLPSTIPFPSPTPSDSMVGTALIAALTGLLVFAAGRN